MLVIYLALLTMRSTIPDLSPDQWNSLDLELCRLQGELHHDLGMEILPAHEAGDVYTMMLVDFLSSKPEFQQEAPRYFIHSPPRSLDQAREEKNRLRKKLNKKDATAEDRRLFQQALKYYSFTLAKSKENAEDAKRRKHEKLFRTKFYKFAKAACNGTLDQDPVGPTFSKETADIFFPGRYSTAVPIDPAKLSWFPPAPPPTSAYAVTLFTPSLVKSILKGRRATTAPGEDGLMFGVFSKLPSSHHFLATLYNKVDKQTIAPTSWTVCKIVLSHMDGSTKEPSNFRPLALASILGKIYHQVKAGKMSDFMIENGKKVPLKFNFGAPSCVPATSFESAGAVINANDIKLMMENPDINYLAEMMNYPGVLLDDEEVLQKIEHAKNNNKPMKRNKI